MLIEYEFFSMIPAHSLVSTGRLVITLHVRSKTSLKNIFEFKFSRSTMSETEENQEMEEESVYSQVVIDPDAPRLELCKPAPKFSGIAVVNGEFKTISLDDYKGKYLVFFFYPADFTFVCPTEIIAFSERYPEFKKIGCEVVAASCDSHYSHFAWISTPRKMGGLGPMNIPIIADQNFKIAKSYACYLHHEGAAFRALYIIDDKQILRQITINDLPVGRDIDEILRLVQAYQFTDKYGTMTPANWKPGQKSIKPTLDEEPLDEFESI